MSTPTNIEKTNLEAHVEICAVRYHNLENKLETLEDRLDKHTESINERIDRIDSNINDIKDQLTAREVEKQGKNFSILASLVIALISAVLAYIFKK
jgi:tetrahydromethanopterin S-methyltransferase subunit G